MEQFKSTYLSKCAEISVEPLILLLNIFTDYENRDKNTKMSSETLDLSGISISIKACTSLAAALSDNQFFTKLILADCFLGDDGCIKIANAIKPNGTLKYLDLRGNSIRSDGAVAIGQMLKVNNVLEQ
jgi:Leucine Rich repeat